MPLCSPEDMRGVDPVAVAAIRTRRRPARPVYGYVRRDASNIPEAPRDRGALSSVFVKRKRLELTFMGRARVSCAQSIYAGTMKGRKGACRGSAYSRVWERLQFRCRREAGRLS